MGKKILIIRFSSIGDIVLTTPVIRAIKTQLDDAEVHYCTKKTFRFLVEDNPYVDKVHSLDQSLTDLIRTLKKERYDHILDLHHNLRTRLLTARLQRPVSRFNKLNLEKWLLVNFKINRLPNRHIVDRYLDTARDLGVSDDTLGLDYFIPEKDHVDPEWLPAGFQKEFVAVVIGARHATKKLPLKRMIELCDRINKPIVLLGGPDDSETGEAIVRFFERRPEAAHLEESLREMNKKSIIFNACGKFNFNQSASLVRQARYVFTHDTGLMHVAAAFKKHIFSIWGNTIPGFGMYPYKTKFVVFENNALSCRPCTKIGFKKCPKGHFNCMNKLNFDFYLP